MRKSIKIALYTTAIVLAALISLTIIVKRTGSTRSWTIWLIVDKGGKLIGSHTVWLIRPDNEARTEEPNVQVAISKIRSWADSLARDMSAVNQTDNYHLPN